MLNPKVGELSPPVGLIRAWTVVAIHRVAVPGIWMTIFPALISIAAGLIVPSKQDWILQVQILQALDDDVLRVHLMSTYNIPILGLRVPDF